MEKASKTKDINRNSGNTPRDPLLIERVDARKLHGKKEKKRSMSFIDHQKTR